MSKFFNELKRRNVLKETIAYLVVAWLILQIAAVVLPIWDISEWVLQIITITLALGLPLWILFSWNYEITISGIKKTTTTSNNQSKNTKLNTGLNILIMAAITGIIALIWIKPDIISSKVSSSKLTIAVLPFEDMSSGGDSEWFCDGVTEDILTYLSKIKGLKVISRTSIMKFKNTEKTLPEIAKELGVSYLVEGSVRKQNNRVLITAQLIQANDEHLWADSYNESLDDVFKIQQEVSKKIVNQLKIVISPEEEKGLNSSSTTNVEAYQLYLKGRNIADQRTIPDVEKSIELYKQAVNLDPNYADAYAEIANSMSLLVLFTPIDKNPNAEEYKKYIDYVDKALSINPNTSRAYSVLGNHYRHEKNSEKAKEAYEKAIEINPNDATAHHHFAIYYRDLDEYDGENELKHINEAYQLDPLSYPINGLRLTALINNFNIDEAKIQLEKSKYLYTNLDIINYEALINTLGKKDATQFIISFKKAIKEEPNNARLLSLLGEHYGDILNDKSNQLKYIKQAYELDSNSKNIAFLYVYALFAEKEFIVANELLNSSGFVELLGERNKLLMWQDYYAYQSNFKQALIYNEQLKEINIHFYYSQKAWLYALMDDAETVHNILYSTTNNYNYRWSTKAEIYAILKMTDSMYYYLDRVSKIYNLKRRLNLSVGINGSEQFDSYRKESRFIEFLKQSYIPLTLDLETNK